MAGQGFPETDYDQMSLRYDANRDVPPAWLEPWREAISRYAMNVAEPVLDVGSGTGIWSLLLAEWFEILVVGIEPSAGMRSQAVARRRHDLVSYVGGDAMALPFRDHSFGGVWLSTVVHHIPDLERAARELRRILRPGQPVLVRNGFSGRHEGVLWTRFFPEGLRLADERHPTIDAVLEAFAGAGFGHEALERVTYNCAANLKEYVERIATRADSTLALIDDSDFERGLAELSRFAAGASLGPVPATLDLLVLR